MTSNIGSELIRDRMESHNNNLNDDQEEALRNDVFALLRKFMRPEFLNRVDDIVMFKPLTKEQISMIVKLQIENLRKLLAAKGISVIVSGEAINWIAQHGYDPQLGARPVKRLIQREIVNLLSKEIIAGRIMHNDKVEMDTENGSIVFRTLKSEPLPE